MFSYVIDGNESTGVHAIDLTLKKVKQLSIRQRVHHRSQVFDDVFPIVTFAQHIRMAKAAPRVVGIYPETKHPSWHDSVLASRGQKTTITEVVINMLKKHGYDNKVGSPEWLAQPVLLQSFELLNENAMPLVDGSYSSYNDMMSKESLVDIATYAYGICPWKESLVKKIEDVDGSVSMQSKRLIERTHAESLVDIATYAYGICPWKESLVKKIEDVDGSVSLQSTGLVERAHALGLNVHAYTFRNEAQYHTKCLDSIGDEYGFYFKELGIDGGFADFPGSMAQWMRNEMANGTEWSKRGRQEEEAAMMIETANGTEWPKRSRQEEEAAMKYAASRLGVDLGFWGIAHETVNITEWPKRSSQEEESDMK
eukprot:gene22224-29289_t